MSDTFTFQDYQKHKFQYQEDGENLLLEKKHACLYYEPGKGKTYPAIAALLQVVNDNDNVLILSTADSIRNMWRVDIVPQNILPRNTWLMSFTQAIQESRKNVLINTRFKAIIVDECHKVKSNATQISKLVFHLTKKAEYVFGLTGTPRGNVDLDIFCQFHNLNISEWGKVTYTSFVNTCCDTEEKYGPYGAFRQVIGINKKYVPGWERNIAMYTQRVTYDDEEMPPLDIREVYLPWEESEYYKELKQGILRIDDDASTLTKLAAISKLHQAANGFLYYREQNSGFQETNRFEFNRKLNWLDQHIGDNPVTIVYRHKADLEILCEHLVGWTEDIGEFKSGKKYILLLQCSRCESFNLQMCNHMIFFTMDYSFIKFKQMLHRVWRTGQEDSTLIEVLIFKSSIEEKIYAAVKNKKNMHDLFMSVKGDT